jgi:hypothetical protein
MRRGRMRRGRNSRRISNPNPTSPDKGTIEGLKKDLIIIYSSLKRNGLPSENYTSKEESHNDRCLCSNKTCPGYKITK